MLPMGEYDNLDNKSSDIINSIANNGGKQIVEVCLSSTVCILGSQDCDIINEERLIFFPLQEERYSTCEQIEHDMQWTNRYLFIPAFDCSGVEKKGPFHIRFLNSFSLPKQLIFHRLKSMRVVQLNQYARDIFRGKIQQFFGRLPIDQYVFFDEDQLNDVVQAKFKDKKLRPEDRDRWFSELKWGLRRANRGEIIEKIYWKMFPEEKVQLYLKKLKDLNMDKETIPLADLFDSLLKTKNFFEKENLFSKIKKELFEGSSCFIEKFGSRVEELCTLKPSDTKRQFLSKIILFLQNERKEHLENSAQH